jgi:putative transposase
MRAHQSGAKGRDRRRGVPGKQLCLAFPNSWGGRRKGAGRKARAKRGMVAHRVRPTHRAREPVHITMRVTIRSLRSQFLFPTVVGAIADTNRWRSQQFRIVQFSVQRDHLHLIVEANERATLITGMRSLSGRLARRVNRLLFRRGPLIADRWHQHALSTPRAVRHALVYVMGNFRKHAVDSHCAVDPCSSAPYFPGFAEFQGVTPIATNPTLVPHPLRGRAPPIPSASTWLLRTGWLRHGPISINEIPRH